MVAAAPDKELAPAEFVPSVQVTPSFSANEFSYKAMPVATRTAMVVKAPEIVVVLAALISVLLEPVASAVVVSVASSGASVASVELAPVEHYHP
jgi:hypothetical protein